VAFIGTNNLAQLLQNSNIITPFDKDRIKNGSYELSLGCQVFQTDSEARVVKELAFGEKIRIKPGHFALLLTEETVNIPETTIAFISIKAKIKFKGLVNVSGFHVDPGFNGKLLFSVYNAGPSTIILKRGEKYFPIWFAELNESQKYIGTHGGQNEIPDEPVEALSQGNLTSPNILSERIDKLDLRKNYTQWLLITLIIVLGGLWLKGCYDVNETKKAIDFGYQKKVDELNNDSLNRINKTQFDSLRIELDTLKIQLKNLSKNNENR